MALKDTIRQHMNQARKEQNDFVRNTLGTVLGEIETKEKMNKNGDILSDQQVEDILRKMVKTRRETAEIYKQAQAEDRSQKEQKEADLIEDFLPELLDENATKIIVEKIIIENNLQNSGPRGIGKVMKAIKTNNNIDNAIASKIAKEMLT